MKKIGLLVTVATLSLLLTGCKTKDDIYLDIPEDTNLEFWITQRVTSEDLLAKGCTYLPGWFGAEEYLDSRYVADTSETMAKAPEVHVTYLLTGYPDTLDERAITRIEITDPSITVYGLTLNSTVEEIEERMIKVAHLYNATTFGDNYSITFSKFTFLFTPEKITISAEVTNNQGIIY